MTNQTDMVLTPLRANAVIRTGIVTAVNGDSLVVDVSGVPIVAGYQRHYAPIEGDTVALAVQDASWLVLGAIVAASPGSAEDGPRRVQSGTALVSFTTLASFTLAVTFPVPFTVVPQVVTNIASGAGNTARWGSRAITVTTDGFEIFVFDGDLPVANETWADIPVDWIATAQENV